MSPQNQEFDPDSPAMAGAGLFGLSVPVEECRVRVLGVPFDATTSYRPGAAKGPQAILDASHQVDLFDLAQSEFPGGDGRPWSAGIHMWIDEEIETWNEEARPLAEGIIELGGRIKDHPTLGIDLKRVNELGARVNERVRKWTRDVLADEALPVIVGGDHSVPFGAISAAAEQQSSLGILHIDAHADLRPAYEGFTWSHASILHNVLAHNPSVQGLLSVGLRDIGEVELRAIEESAGRVRAIHDHQWARALREEPDLLGFARRQIEALPQAIWLTVDIDGLDPKLCPNTGTPVPGGLDWASMLLWLEALAHSGKRVVGLDLCEVSPGQDSHPDQDSWDAIVGARLLYKQIGTALALARD